MRYFKLLLLWLLPLLSIGSFTSASDDFVFNFSNYDSFSFPMNVSEYNVSFTNVWELCNLSLANKNLTNYCSISYNGWNISNWCSSLEMSWPFRPRYNWYCQWWYIKFTPKPYTPIKDLPMAINSLDEVLTEFIPFVVYVWIWVLGALIGFFAIRRLINRVRRQTFSVFKFKRKK